MLDLACASIPDDSSQRGTKPVPADEILGFARRVRRVMRLP